MNVDWSAIFKDWKKSAAFAFALTGVFLYIQRDTWNKKRNGDGQVINGQFIVKNATFVACLTALIFYLAKNGLGMSGGRSFMIVEPANF